VYTAVMKTIGISSHLASFFMRRAVPAVHFGHHHVEENHVDVLPRLEERERLRSARGRRSALRRDLETRRHRQTSCIDVSACREEH
jgi:hypothetical protein